MLNLNATLRKSKNETGQPFGLVYAVVYGPDVKNENIQVPEREFLKVLKEAGENSLIELVIEGVKEKKPVLVKEVQKNPVSGKIIHIDFYQPDWKEAVEVAIPLVFEGVAPAEKDLGGTLNKNILEVLVRALPQNLPHEIKVDVSKLNTFQDHIFVKDLVVSKDVEILKDADEIVASVLEPQKIEEELAAEIVENVEDVVKVEKEKKEEIVPEILEDKK